MTTWSKNFSYLVDVSLSTLCSASSLLSTLYGGILGGTRARRRVRTEAGGSVCSSSGPGPIRRLPRWWWPQDERLPGKRLFCPESWSLVNNSLRTCIYKMGWCGFYNTRSEEESENKILRLLEHWVKEGWCKEGWLILGCHPFLSLVLDRTQWDSMWK